MGVYFISFHITNSNLLQGLIFKSTMQPMNLNRIIIISGFFLVASTLSAKGYFSPGDTTLAHSFKVKAYEFAKASSYDSAIIFFEKAAEQYRNQLVWDQFVVCYTEIAENQWKVGDYKSANKFVTDALSIGKKELDKKNPILAKVYHSQAVLKDIAGEADEALLLFDKSLNIRLETLGKDHPEVATSYFDQGILYRNIGEFDKAVELFHKSLRIRIERFGENNADVAACYNVLGVMSDNMGQYIEALEYYQKALDIRIATLGKDHPDVATTYSNVSILYKTKGDFEKADKYNQMALASRLNNFGDNHPVVATTYNNMGIVYQLMGDFEKSLDFHNKALEMRMKFFGTNHSEVAASYQNIAITHSEKKDFTKALQYYKKALDIDSITFGPNHPYVAGGYFNMGVVFKDQGDYSRAIESFNKAIHIDIDVLGESHPHIATSYNYLGQAYTKQEDYEVGLSYFNKAMEIYDKSEGSPELAVALTFQETGNLYLAQKQFQKALGYYQKAIIELCRDFSNEDYCNNPSINQIVSKRQIVTPLHLKAGAIRELHGNDNYSCNTETYKLLIAIVNELRNDYEAEGSKLILAERMEKIFDEGIEAILDIPDTEEPYLATKNALSMAEANKNNLLLEGLLTSKAKKFSGIPDSLLEKEKQLRIDLAFFNHELQQKQSAHDSSSINNLKSRIFNLEQETTALLDQFENDYPEYYQLKYDTQLLDIEDLQKNVLTAQDLVITYHVGDDEIYAFLLTNKGLDYFTVPSQEIGTSVQALLLDIKSHNFDGFAKNAHFLYQKILQPALEITNAKTQGYDHLIVIPDGTLGYIPFESLIQSAHKAGDSYKDLDYLVREFKVTNQYSPKLLALNRFKKESRPKNKFLGFAPTFINKTSDQYLALNERTRAFLDTLTALPDAEKEVAAIAKLLGGKAEIGLTATEHNFKQMADNYEILHLASHSIIEDEAPLYSRLLFDNEQDSIDDGFLHTYELYNMDLNADLVTLSSCNTGVGKLYKGEGIMSLARGFMYAGVPNLVMSLWSVSDKPTKDLMTYFYEELRSGESKSAALRKAKLRYLQQADDRTADPYYWGSFIYVGQVESESTSNLKLIVGLLLGLILVSVMLVFWQKKKRSSARAS